MKRSTSIENPGNFASDSDLPRLMHRLLERTLKNPYDLEVTRAIQTLNSINKSLNPYTHTMDNQKEILSEERVNEIFEKLLFKDDELRGGKPIVEPIWGMGRQNEFGFFPERLNARKEEIMNMLLELPDQFKESEGGGYPFISAQYRKDMTFWTTNLQHVEQLMAMGHALGFIVFRTKKELWKDLPGGGPIFAVKDQNKI